MTTGMSRASIEPTSSGSRAGHDRREWPVDAASTALPPAADKLLEAGLEPSLSARMEPFDTYWQGSRDLSRDYARFAVYYRANYLPRLPADRDAAIAVLSCGPGYLVKTLVDDGYRNAVGIDADPAKIRHAHERRLPCEVASVWPFLQANPGRFDMIIPEQELNHLTLDETIAFLKLARQALRPDGQILVYAINGANPLVSPEHIAHNIDHFYNVTDYSLKQILTLGGFTRIEPFGCELYVFWDRPDNYVGWLITKTIEAFCRVVYRLYGKDVSILAKRIAATATRSRSF